MKILVSENQLKKLISEDLGVSRPSIAYSNLIYKNIEPIFLKLVDDVVGGKKKSETKVILGLDKIKQVWQQSMDDYLELPIELIEINVDVEKIEKEFDSISFSTGGGALEIQKNKTHSYLKKPSMSLPKKILEEPEVNKTLVSKIELSASINDKYNKDFEEKLLLDLRDTIVHELNHVLEYYMRFKNNQKMDIRFSAVNPKPKNIPDEILTVWKWFLEFLEFSQPQEMNAITQEMYSKKLRMTFDEFKNTRYWKFATYMSAFDADIYFDFLIEKMEKYSNDEKIYILTELYNSFVNAYETITKRWGYPENKKISESKHFYDLIKKFQPQIQNSGKKLISKFVKLYGLKEY